MITEKDIKFIKNYVNDKYFDVERLISYLRMHDKVGDEIFDITKRKNLDFNLKLVKKDYGYVPVKTEVFVKRIPFYFYVSREYDEYGDLHNLVNAYIREELHSRKTKDWEELYMKLEKLFYHHKIDVQNIMGYFNNQTHFVNRIDIFEKWIDYLDLCEKLNINNHFPVNILYEYNQILEECGLEPIIYTPGLVGYNEEFLRRGNEIVI